MNGLNGLLELLRADGSIIINKAMARKIGIYETILYSELVSKYIYYKNKETLFQFKDMNGEWFYSTIEDIQESIPMTAYEQRKAITKLKEIGLIEHTNKKPQGFANQTRFFSIKEDVHLIISLLNENKEQKNKKTLESINNSRKLKNLVFESENNEFSKVKKFNTNNTNINNTNLINNNIVGKPDSTENFNSKESTKKEKSKEVIQDDNTKIIEEVITYLNTKVNKNFKSTTKKYISLINALINQNYTLEDMKKVIDNKVLDWLNDAKYDTFLRPSTLFGSKFDEYLNEKPKSKEVIQDNNNTKIKPWQYSNQRKCTSDYFEGLYKNL